jgi:hypothetical protein
VAIFGSLFTRAVQGPLPGTGPSPHATALTRLPAAARDAYLHGVATGTQHIFLLAAAIAAIAFLAALLIREVAAAQPARHQPPQPRRPASGHPCARSRVPPQVSDKRLVARHRSEVTHPSPPCPRSRFDKTPVVPSIRKALS